MTFSSLRTVAASHIFHIACSWGYTHTLSLTLLFLQMSLVSMRVEVALTIASKRWSRKLHLDPDHYSWDRNGTARRPPFWQQVLIIEQLQETQPCAGCPWSFLPPTSLISINLKPLLEEHQAQTCSRLFTHRLGWLFDILLEWGRGLASLTRPSLCSALPSYPVCRGQSRERVRLCGADPPFLLLCCPP